MAIHLSKEDLFKCCGSTAWADEMFSKNPFGSLSEIKSLSDKTWFSLSEKDWKEAFSHHPEIGDTASLRKKFAATASWAAGEQSGVHQAGEKVLQELKVCNDLYKARFGYIFIVCATGKSAEEMLTLLKKRLINNPANEIMIAAEEQNKITHLRLDKLFA